MNGLRLPKPATLVRALISAGHLAVACATARQLLAGPLPRGATAEVRAALVTALALRGNGPKAVAEADHLLAAGELPAELAATVSATRLIVLAGYDPDGAERLARSLSRGARPRQPVLRATALAVLANAQWRRGHLTDAFALARAACRAGEGAAVPFGGDEALAPARGFPPAVLADKLASIGEIAEADRVLRQFADTVGDFDRGSHGIVVAALQSRIHARAGRFERSLERASYAVALAEWAKAHSLIPYTRLVLTEVAVRLGDLGTAMASLAAAGRDLRWSAFTDMGARHAAATLHLAEAAEGTVAAGTRLSRDFAWLAGAPVALSAGPTTAAWLARLALAVGDDHLADQTVTTARRLAAANPRLAGVEIAATHAEAVLHADPDLLSKVVTRHTDPWSRARTLEDRALILAEQSPAADRRAVTDAWGLALAGYRETNARGDEVRVEATLRQLGRRRRSRAGRPADSGWPQLTDQEAAVAELVAQGMTNQGAARRLHLSPHTVNFHLRTIFRKLGIRSRVELAHLHGAHSVSPFAPDSQALA